MTTGHFTYSSITSHWFIPVYLFITRKKTPFPLDCCAKSLHVDVLVLCVKLSGSLYQNPLLKVLVHPTLECSPPPLPLQLPHGYCPYLHRPSTPWLSNHLLSNTQPPGSLFMSLSRGELSTPPTNAPLWIIIHSILVNLRKDHRLYIQNLLWKHNWLIF